jgi:hypothetical protein
MKKKKSLRETPTDQAKELAKDLKTMAATHWDSGWAAWARYLLARGWTKL